MVNKKRSNKHQLYQYMCHYAIVKTKQCKVDLYITCAELVLVSLWNIVNI